MKKFISILLVVLMAFSFVGCGDTGGNENGKGEDDHSGDIALVLQQGGLGDKGYNDDGLAGLQKLEADYGIGYTTVEPTDLAQGETYLRELGDQGYGVIISIEYGIKDYMYSVAKDYPDTIFVIFGKYSTDDNKASDNVVELTFNYCEHSYLAGVLAAYLAEGNTIIDGRAQQEGTNIAFLGATESLGFYRYSDGFYQGATDYDPDCNVYIDFTSGFSDTTTCKTIAENMIKNNHCDVIWTCCGTAGLGGLEACRENNVFGIGVDCNQDYLEPGYIVTSVMRNTATSIYQIGTLFKDGKLKGAEINCNLANGTLDITDMSTIAEYVTNTENFEFLKALINQTRQDIIDGKITVYDCSESGVRFVELPEDQQKAFNADYTFYGR